MTETPEQERTPTVQRLAAELARLRQRIEDLEDARELDAAISRNIGKPLIPWDEKKADSVRSATLVTLYGPTR